jgi:hypothetical protein
MQRLINKISEKRYRSNNSDNVPLQLYKTCAKPTLAEEQDECRDDDVCIGAILQRSATTSRAKNEEVEDEELRIAMQRAWALLDSNNETTILPTPVTAAVPVEVSKHFLVGSLNMYVCNKNLFIIVIY